jgi:hypothetical protein
MTPLKKKFVPQTPKYMHLKTLPAKEAKAVKVQNFHRLGEDQFKRANGRGYLMKAAGCTGKSDGGNCLPTISEHQPAAKLIRN